MLPQVVGQIIRPGVDDQEVRPADANGGALESDDVDREGLDMEDYEVDPSSGPDISDTHGPDVSGSVLPPPDTSAAPSSSTSSALPTGRPFPTMSTSSLDSVEPSRRFWERGCVW